MYAFTVTPGPDAPLGSVLATEARAASPFTTGTFRIAANSECEYVDVNALDDYVPSIGAKLASLPGLSNSSNVARGYGSDSATYVSVTLDAYAHSPTANQPSLRLVDSRGLSYQDATTLFVPAWAAPPEQAFERLPVDFFQLPVAGPGSIRLIVNDAAAACVHPSGICSFRYDSTATPTVAAVQPQSLTWPTDTPAVTAAAGNAAAELTINGRGLNTTTAAAAAGEQVWVMVSGANCTITAVNDTQIVCNVPWAALATGQRQVVVYVPGRGYAAGTPPLLVSAFAVRAVVPAALPLAAGDGSSSSNGGMALLQISGQGLVDAADVAAAAAAGGNPCAGLGVSVGGVACGLVACGPSQLLALYPGGGAAVADGMSMPLELQVRLTRCKVAGRFDQWRRREHHTCQRTQADERACLQAGTEQARTWPHRADRCFLADF